ncbi:Crp/Fnr family transcriptional regulator [Pseudoalteromonas denitrificans]|uniref:Cyclic nucleotide-binding domain-containing protein n=1 Tax=Pseudoalteromonas denitrificans DSM 6059 TaxID=1123010 RepID=A0A1I1RDN2_9GAMM|nr:cyclic nucleotide-binding domain-containing protein [Pseudoalteromonas denitrificans]SFD28490.1 Cyclic nucleotide-binding domain-containing protein [Pseudoalteromonas denitrificans DSM 6059]
MKLIENIPLIKQMEITNRLNFFNNFSLSERQVLLESFSQLYLVHQKRFVFKQFDDDKNLYIILSGSLTMYRQNDMVELATVYPGEFIGEGGFINQSERSINARAIEDSILLVITPKSLTKLPAVIREKMKDKIIFGMSKRIEQLSRLLEKKQL